MECTANIGPVQRRRRVIGGSVMALITCAAAVAMIATGAPRQVRVLVALPAMGAALGFFQAQAKTCVALAAHGLRNMDDGNRPVSDPGEIARLRVQSRHVYIKAIVATVVVTGVILTL